jgi:hypothetical protein
VASATQIETSEAAIFSRIFEPEKPTLSAEAAASLLKLDFNRRDRERMNQLSAKASEGSLTAEEDAELENYIHVNHLLTIIQSKARRSLQRHEHPTS